MRLIPRRVVNAGAQYQSLRLERIGRNSSQTEVLQSPWIPETCLYVLLPHIFVIVFVFQAKMCIFQASLTAHCTALLTSRHLAAKLTAVR